MSTSLNLSVKLPKRLRAIAELVPCGSRVCDVGTDHGLLPVWLVINGVCPTAIAADVSRKCLEKARLFAEHCGVSDRVRVRLSDGLQDIQASEWDTLVVAGMGGETIAQILEPLQREPQNPLQREPQNPLQHKTLILQPNTKQLELLRFLQASGYAVEQEVLVRDRRRDYYIVAASA